MKKTLFLFCLLVIGVTSCKKDRVCTCTTTSTFTSNGSTSVSTGTTTQTITHVKESDANLVCTDYKSTDTEAGSNGYTSVSTTDCTLK